MADTPSTNAVRLAVRAVPSALAIIVSPYERIAVDVSVFIA
jgi:hypothetical protein